MKWIQLAAGAAAAACVASYAAASPFEAELGRPLKGLGHGEARGPAPAFAAPARSSPAQFGRTLRRLRPEAASATRGATDSRVYVRAAPAVVLVVTPDGLGSGVLIAADGQIVTNLHVVQGAKQIAVAFKPALEGAAVAKAGLRRAKVLKVDEVADLALLKVDEIPAGVAPLPLGDSGKLQIGANVHAIGHPTGETWTYTRGIVSQIRRAYEWKADDKVAHEATVIQTQTPINPGNSGGPLLDDQANVVGINSFGAPGEGLNFAVSAEDVKSFLARGHDRAVAPAAAEKSCEWQDMGAEDVKTPIAGKLYTVDTDCDGEADSLFLKASRRRDPDVLMTGDSGQGKIDTMLFDADHDGGAEWALYDTDGDEKFDMRGDFHKGEDEPYRWEKITPTR